VAELKIFIKNTKIFRMNFFKRLLIKTKNFLKDRYHLLFKGAAENHLRIQQALQNPDGTYQMTLKFASYTELKKYQKKLRRITVSLSSAAAMIVVAFIVSPYIMNPNKSAASNYGWTQTAWDAAASVGSIIVHPAVGTSWVAGDAGIFVGTGTSKIWGTGGVVGSTTPGAYAWTVPAGVTQVTIEAAGAGGEGGVGGSCWSGAGGNGLAGDKVTGTLNVIPGTNLNLIVAGGGTYGNPNGSGASNGGAGGGRTTIALPDSSIAAAAAGGTGGGEGGGVSSGEGGKPSIASSASFSGTLLAGQGASGGAGGNDPSCEAAGDVGQTGWVKITYGSGASDVTLELPTPSSAKDADYAVASVPTIPTGAYRDASNNLVLKKQYSASCTGIGNGECVSGACVAGVCMKADGNACTSNTQCATGWCSSLVCVNPWKSIAACKTAANAALFVYKSDYGSGGPYDSYCSPVGGRLPTATELACIYNNRTSYTGTFDTSGAMTGYYWSSTPSGGGYIDIRFYNGAQAAAGSQNSFSIRCVKG
jgi:hypothetical protein